MKKVSEIKFGFHKVAVLAHEEDPERDSFRNHWVATKLPVGKALFFDAGISSNKDMLVKFIEFCKNRPEKLYLVSAEDVGLEWHEDGKKVCWSDSYVKNQYILLKDV